MRDSNKRVKSICRVRTKPIPNHIYGENTKLYYCIDNSYGLMVGGSVDNNSCDQHIYEKQGANGSLYRIVNKCSKYGRYSYPHPRQRLDIIVESIETGKRYYVQKRFYIELDTPKKKALTIDEKIQEAKAILDMLRKERDGRK